MVINEMRLDMSLKDHRKLLKKHEKVFVGVLTPEGDVLIIQMKIIEIRKNHLPKNQLIF